MSFQNWSRMMKDALKNDSKLDFLTTETPSLLPQVDDTPMYLGDGTTSWDLRVYGNTSSDYLSWDASANTLFFVGDTTFVLGHTAQLTISDGDGATNLIPEMQVLGTAKADSSILLGSFNTTDDTTVAPSLNFLKSGNATIGSNTVVASGEVLGEINFFGADGTDFESCAVSIRGLANAAAGAGDMPGRLSIFTSTDGAETPTERARITGTATVATLQLGLAGATQGQLILAGNTSGTQTFNVPAAAGTLTYTLPPDAGAAGEQLQTDGAGVLTWEAAASFREAKELIEEISRKAHEALTRIVNVPVYEFRYKEGQRGVGGDYAKVYHGVLSDEYPEVMKHNGRIFDPITAFGELVLAIKELTYRLGIVEASVVV